MAEADVKRDERGDARCKHCGGVIRLINYSMGKKWMHVNPSAGFPTEHKGTAWWHCHNTIAEPTVLIERDVDQVPGQEGP